MAVAQFVSYFLVAIKSFFLLEMKTKTAHEHLMANVRERFNVKKT
jgi:hypothetical protein